jgi:AraC-like DNA-binding protein
VKTNCVLTGTNPPQFLSIEQLAERARHCGFEACRLAHGLGLTPRTFERRFRTAFGCPPRLWLAEQQMREALALLETGWNTKQVAVALGYGHPPSFFREFRRCFGCTPVEYLAKRSEPLRIVLAPPPAGWLSQTAIFLSQSATSRGLPLAQAV